MRDVLALSSVRRPESHASTHTHNSISVVCVADDDDWPVSDGGSTANAGAGAAAAVDSMRVAMQYADGTGAACSVLPRAHAQGVSRERSR